MVGVRLRWDGGVKTFATKSPHMRLYAPGGKMYNSAWGYLRGRHDALRQRRAQSPPAQWFGLSEDAATAAVQTAIKAWGAKSVTLNSLPLGNAQSGEETGANGERHIWQCDGMATLCGCRRPGKRYDVPKLNDPGTETALREALDDLIFGWPEVTTGKMFGSHAYRAGGVLFAMIGGSGSIFTRLGEEQRRLAAAHCGARAFVGHGRELPGWTELALSDAAGVAAVSSLVR